MTDASDAHATLVRSPRAPVRDLGAVVLVGDPGGSARVARLEGPARVVWDELATPTTRSRLSELVTDAVSDPVGADERVDEVLRVLRDIGAIEVA